MTADQVMLATEFKRENSKRVGFIDRGQILVDIGYVMGLAVFQREIMVKSEIKFVGLQRPAEVGVATDNGDAAITRQVRLL